MIPAADRWGPFRAGLDSAERLDPAERLARLRSLRAVARVHCGPRAAELCHLIALAETDGAALEPASAALNRLASVGSRQVLTRPA